MELGGEWISWKCNPLMASNMEGVSEQQIRSARNILSAMLRNYGESLKDESLHTLLVEVEGIINSRPITCESVCWCQQYYSIESNATANFKDKGKGSHATTRSFPERRQVQLKAVMICSAFVKQILDKMEERGVYNTSDKEKVEPDLVIILSKGYCFGMWQCYSKQMANDANTESAHCRRRTSSKCSVDDWNNKFHLQRDINFWSTCKQTGFASWKWTMKSYWSISWWQECKC